MRRTRRPAGLAGLSALVGAVLALGLVTGIGARAGASAGSANEAALAQAKHQLIVRSDFPKSWKVSGAATTSAGGGQSSFPGADQLASCLGVPSALINMNTPSASSPDFQSSDGRFNAQENLSIFPSSKVASKGYRVLASTKVPGCMTSLLQGPEKSQLQNAIGHGITIGTVTVTGVPRSALGSHASGFTISFPAMTQEVTLPTTVTIIDVLRGKLGAQLMLSAVGQTFPASLEKHLVAAAYSRA
jgi:hypothetical protein